MCRILAKCQMLAFLIWRSLATQGIFLYKKPHFLVSGKKKLVLQEHLSAWKLLETMHCLPGDSLEVCRISKWPPKSRALLWEGRGKQEPGSLAAQQTISRKLPQYSSLVGFSMYLSQCSVQQYPECLLFNVSELALLADAITG